MLSLLINIGLVFLFNFSKKEKAKPSFWFKKWFKEWFSKKKRPSKHWCI